MELINRCQFQNWKNRGNLPSHTIIFLILLKNGLRSELIAFGLLLIKEMALLSREEITTSMGSKLVQEAPLIVEGYSERREEALW